MFETSRMDIGKDSVPLPSIDCYTSCYSTFTMIRQAYGARILLNGLMYLLSKLQEFFVSYADWERGYNICDLLNTTAKITQSTSVSQHVIFSFFVLAYSLLMR